MVGVGLAGVSSPHYRRLGAELELQRQQVPDAGIASAEQHLQVEAAQRAAPQGW